LLQLWQQQQQPPPAAAIHTYPRTAATIRIISERNLQQQQQPPPKETGNDYTPSATFTFWRFHSDFRVYSTS
jgi:hypothetical protein